ncbi:Transcriptional regulator, GntR family [Marinobacterium lacunae]|uniref:Transcriptional regulator, GntR family n=1 Tax=Marinobacterium lacunae TaxID=1232683 RepID=A0A081FZL0_9GAMM|nr:FCD domain-containing protein [Marinobacterium lacunae]KEA63965.1 Transcriptional regulator, GntR family [Marinobacterium lacunae]
MAEHVFAFEQALRNKTKKEILAGKLLEMIFCGLLRDGDELPSERDLGQLFGVSRETVRGALGVIAAYGLIQVSHGAKTRIRRTEALLARCAELAPELVDLEINNFDLSTVYESRKIVEVAIARRAAANISDAGLSEMKALLAQQRKLFDEPVHFQLADKRFHKIIAEHGSNEILLSYSEELYAYGLNFRRQVMVQPGMIENSYQEHQEIYTALLERDAAAAEAAMLRHLDSVYRTTAAIMGD